ISTQGLAAGPGRQTRVAQRKGANNIGPRLFHFIPRVELKVSEDEFWQALRSGEPASRPAHPAPPPVSRKPSAGLVFQLRKHLHLTDVEISRLSKDEAVEMLNEHFSTSPEDRRAD